MGVEIQIPPPLNYEGEIEYDAKAWASARDEFKANRKAQKKSADNDEALDDFLRQSCSAEDARSYVDKVKKERPQYNVALGGILTKIDTFMKVGDLAIKSAPESIGLAWAGIRLCLHSVQDDFATFSQYNEACGDMIGILISCTVYGGMYGKPHGAKILEEIHGQVLDCIPSIYAQILDFNYSMRKHTQTHKGIRVLKGLYKSAAAKYKEKFDALKANEQKMRGFAQTASQQLTQFYQEKGLENDAKSLQATSAILSSLSSIDQAIRSQEEHLNRIEDTMKDLKKHTPFEKAKRAFSANEQKLDPALHYQEAALEETHLGREPGTCQWIFKTEEYRGWHTSDASSLLWISAAGGFGKSFLMGNIIQTLQKTEEVDESITVSYFFCKRGNDSTQRSERIKKSVIFQLYQQAKDNSDVLEEANKLISSLDISVKSKKETRGSGSKGESNKKTATFVEVYQGLARLLKKTVFLVIDALDEIDDRIDEAFLEEFLSLTEAPDVKIHIIFGSRPEGDLNSALKDLSAIDVKGRNEADIRQNVTTLVGKLSGFSAAERALAINDIVKKAGGQFRYVKPALDFLRLPWSRPLEKRLEQLQEGLTNSYTQALQLTDPNYHGLLKTCLTWALLAEGQIKVREVMDAFSCTFGVGLDDQDIEDIEDDNQPLKQVEQAGNTFLDVNWKTGVITPRHETVTDYFLNHVETEVELIHANGNDLCQICQKEKHPRNSRPFVITRKAGHLEIAETILQNLSSDAFWRKHYPASYWEKYFPEAQKENEEADKVPQQLIGDQDDEPSDSDDAGSTPESVPQETLNGSVTHSGNFHEKEKEVDIDSETENLKTLKTTIVTTIPTTLSQQAGSIEKQDMRLDLEVSTSDVSTEVSIANDEASSETPIISLTHADGTIALNLDEEAAAAAPAHIDQNNDVANIVEDPDTLAPPAEDAADDASEADSDLNEADDRWWGGGQTRLLPESRYEVSHCIYHLQKVEEYWTEEERQGPEFERLRALMKSFFHKDSPYFKKWVKIQGGTPESFFYWEPLETEPLTVAAAYGLQDLSNILVHLGDNQKIGKDVMTRALMFACLNYKGEDSKPFKILLENGANPNREEDNPGIGCFQMLLYKNIRLDLVNLFLDHGGKVEPPNDQAWGHMHYFSISGENKDVEVLKVLLEHGGDINCKDYDGETPLHQLVRRRDPPLELLKDFISKGAKVNENDTELQKPLYEVCTEGNVEAAKILLDAGAEIHHADQQGITALHAAALYGHPKTCQLLIERGADLTKLDKRNRSPFLLACGSKNVETALYLANQIKDTDLHLFTLKTNTGKSPLTKAAGRGHTELVKMLLSKTDLGIDVNEQDTKRGYTPLYVAAMNSSRDIVDLLLENGASTTVTDKKGNTPFKACCKRWAQSSSNDATALLSLIDSESADTLAHDRELLSTAAVKGSVPVLNKLLDKGANLNQQDEHGWTPLQLANQYGHVEAVKLLSKRGAVIGRKPTGWSCTMDTIKVSDENNKVVEYIATDRNETGVLADHPIPAGVKRYYYEISVTEPDGKKASPPVLGLGLTNAVSKTNEWFPGWPNRTSGGTFSWGYHGDDGGLFTDKKGSRTSEGDMPLGTFAHGDVIGCAVDFDKGEIFFTRNGETTEVVFREVKGRLYPVVGMASAVSVEANFGEDILEKPFKWARGNVAGGGWAD